MKDTPRIDSEIAQIVYSKRPDGNMSFKWGDREPVIRNRNAFLVQNGSSLKESVTMQVLNEDKVTVVDDQEFGKGMEDPKTAVHTDALITNIKNLGLFLFVGDCIPMTLLDPVNRILSAAHLGWRSTDAGLAVRVIEKMSQAFGSKAKDIQVEMGPSIHKESYKRPDFERQASKDWLPFLKPTADARTSIDLHGYNEKQLVDAGVNPENIYISNVDTAIDQEFFSHYRSIGTGEPEGRFAVLSKLT